MNEQLWDHRLYGTLFSAIGNRASAFPSSNRTDLAVLVVCRQPGHYTRFGLTSGWAVNRSKQVNE